MDLLYHKLWALAVLSIVFSFTSGCSIARRNQKSQEILPAIYKQKTLAVINFPLLHPHSFRNSLCGPPQILLCMGGHQRGPQDSLSLLYSRVANRGNIVSLLQKPPGYPCRFPFIPDLDGDHSSLRPNIHSLLFQALAEPSYVFLEPRRPLRLGFQQLHRPKRGGNGCGR